MVHGDNVKITMTSIDDTDERDTDRGDDLRTTILFRGVGGKLCEMVEQRHDISIKDKIRFRGHENKNDK